LKRVQSGDRNEQLKELLHKALQWLGVNKDLDWHAFRSSVNAGHTGRRGPGE
jgi:hypothetical protein